MSIGSNIKRIRREKGITQEKLAELLGLTSSAISQWETDRVLPDITQIPILCNIFDVTSDEILGINNISKNEEIGSIENDAWLSFQNGDYSEAVGIVRVGLEKYPDSYVLMDLLIHFLQFLDRRGTVDERINLCNKILNGSNDEHLKNRVTASLCIAYANKGEHDKALEIAESVVDFPYTKKVCRLFALMDSLQWVDESCKQAYYDLSCAIECLRTVARVVKYRLSNEEAIELWRKIIVFIETLYENGDYGCRYHSLIEGCCDVIYRSLSIGKFEQATDYFEKLVNYLGEIELYFIDPNKRYGCEIEMPSHTSIIPKFYDDYGDTLDIPTVQHYLKNLLDKLSCGELVNIVKIEDLDNIKCFLKYKCDQLEAYIRVNRVEEQ